MAKKNLSQLGATTDGRDFLRKLGGKDSDSGLKNDPETFPTAPFNNMMEAFRFCFAYGLSKKKKLPGSIGTIYNRMEQITQDLDYETLITELGEPEDLDDIGKAINEYVNWAITDIRKKLGTGEFRFSSIL